MMAFTVIGGMVLYYGLGASIDAVAPGAHMLGFNLQALVFSTLCMAAALWLAVRLELFD